MGISLSAILQTAIEQNASDIHLSAQSVPRLRLLGELSPIPNVSPLTSSEVDAFRADLHDHGIITNDKHVTGKISTANHPPDFSYSDPITGRRFRVNAYTTLRGSALALRLIPFDVPSLADISAPPILATLALLPRGLVIVSGPTGSGKTATLAAMVNHVNNHRRSHILTLEDPIEYVHNEVNCLISQREIHGHARGYAAALKDAMREDPDVILVGEMRDPETIRMALTAAETGHLVFSTLHTRSASQSIDRIIDVFPAGEKETVRTMLAESLQGVIAQQLLRHRTQPKRLAVFETLCCTPAIRNCIKDGQTGQIRGQMSTNRQSGMLTLDQALEAKLLTNEISREEACRVAHDPKKFA